MHIPDARKKKYKGLREKNFIFYHRKEGCSYYDQYQAYLDADVIIFNSAKYKIETALDRRPETDVEIIDEADEFLDSFSSQQDLNLTRLSSSLTSVVPEDPDAKMAVDEIIELLKLEEKNKTALGVDENKIYHIKETKMDKVLRLFIKNPELEVELALDEINYGNKAVEVAREFREFLEDTYMTFKRRENDLYASFVTTNLSRKFKEIVDKSKALVLMSGTLHSESVLRNVFGIENFKIVEAEGYQQGTIEIHRTGKEIDCRYSNFSSKKHSREQYLLALANSIEKAKKPVLVHVNSFEDLPSEQEMQNLGIYGVMNKERLMDIQKNDKTGRTISLFKSKSSDSLFTTKCSRGVDFPGDVCNSIVFTKYPNPNVNGTFWKILQKTHPSYYWDFYRDKAKREFLQRIYRGLRSKEDHVYILSPDIRVLDAVKELQREGLS
jgi:Rad3-related DNA helicase